MKTNRLEKFIWDDSDFAVMCWHDATVWSMFKNQDEYEFLFDIDYIFTWVPPDEGGTYLKFWVAPVTMVFENVQKIKIDIESSQGTIDIVELHREESEITPNDKFIQHKYRFECQEGEISLVATGFRMFVRRTPVLLDCQSLTLSQRGGVSFELGFHST